MHIDTPPACSAKTEYLSFTAGGLEYGLDFRKVQELRSLKSLERFASDGEIISGVAVSRGVIMPIVDLRAAFSGCPAVHGPNTDVIILKLSSCVMGMVVDGVTDVVALHPDQVSAIPMADGGTPADYLIGLGQVDGRRLILIDIDRLMSIERRAPASASQAA
jgi:purine-binding chemotaxis protein CheW